MHSLSYRLGHQFGTLVVRARAALITAMLDHPNENEDEDEPLTPLSLKELSDTPAMVRKGVSLNEWCAKNVTCAPPPKPRRKRVKAERKRGALDPLI